MQRITVMPKRWTSAELLNFELWCAYSRSASAEPSWIDLKRYVATYIVDCSLFCSQGLQRKLVRWPVVPMDYDANCAMRRIIVAPTHHGDLQ